MRVAIIAIAFSILAGGLLYGQRPTPPNSPAANVVVNSEKSLAAAVGDGFIDEAWEYPTELLPSKVSGLKYISGPTDAGPSKGAWRKPILLKDEASGAEIFINCYRWQDARKRESTKVKPGAVGTPFVALVEPDYQYKPVKFHDVRAASASAGDRHAFAFRDGDVLFKIETTRGTAESRRDASATVAATIWKFRNVK
jgi:hypothetical protein